MPLHILNLITVQPVTESTRTIYRFRETTMVSNRSITTTNINRAPIPGQLVDSSMKTHEWTPKKRSRALGLIQGGWYSLSEITAIINIPKGTLGDLKKHNTPLNKV